MRFEKDLPPDARKVVTIDLRLIGSAIVFAIVLYWAVWSWG